MKNLYKPTELKNFLNENNLRPKKSLSQNFLIDKNISNLMIKSSSINKEDNILEIGPGPGMLTYSLLEKSNKVIAIEKDEKLFKKLDDLKNPNLLIKNEDFFKTELDFLKPFKKLKVVSSIPYNLTTPIIAKLLNNFQLFSSITLMVQKEVAQRIVAKHGNKTYSSFSVFVNFYSDIEIVKVVSKNSFYPAPKVDSAIIKLTIKEKIEDINFDKFHSMVRLSFSQRRKKAISLLKKEYDFKILKEIFEKLDIDENARAENLSLETFLSIFKNLKSFSQQRI